MSAVPNSVNILLTDIMAAVPGASNDLISCFANANPYKFDPAYNNDTYSPPGYALRFRNYGGLHYLGESFGGGTIVYTDAYNHGLIVSNNYLTDSGSIWIRWYNGANRASISTSSAYGYGLSNTNNIIATIGASGVAATVCKAYTGGGYSDWYLPSIDEGFKILDCYNAGLLPNLIGGSQPKIWTSSQYDAVYAYYIDLYNSSYQWMDDYNQNFVRAVRSF